MGILFSISYMPIHDIFDCAKKKKNMQKVKRIKMLLHDCKHVSQEMWELYDVTL